MGDGGKGNNYINCDTMNGKYSPQNLRKKKLLETNFLMQSGRNNIDITSLSLSLDTFYFKNNR